VRSQTAQWRSRLPGQSFRVNRDAYLDKVDGLLYGDDPRQGFREGELFYLPRHQVQFRIPAQWAFEREGSQAQMVHPQKAGVVLFDIRQGSVDQVARAFVTSLQAKVEQSKERIVNGLKARELQATISDSGKRMRVTSYFFQKEGDVFTFHGLSGEQEFARLAATLSLPANSFAALTDRAKLERQPQRIVVKQVGQSATLEGVLQSYKIDPKEWPLIAWLNEMQPGNRVSAGQRIKIIE
jgi:predicted Zn-dependent protease